jgi:hypothetical protein
MSLKDDLTKRVTTIFKENWDKSDGTTVPDTEAPRVA